MKFHRKDDSRSQENMIAIAKSDNLTKLGLPQKKKRNKFNNLLVSNC